MTGLLTKLMDDSSNYVFTFRVAPNRAPLYILGEEFQATTEEESRVSTLNAITAYKSVFWLHYRSGFPAIAGSNVVSDKGWGCTIRSAQMMAAHALVRAMPGPRFRRAVPCSREVQSVLRLFVDSAEGLLSIHNVVEWALKSKQIQKVTDWVGPDVATNAVASLLSEQREQISDFVEIHSVRDGALIVPDILGALASKAQLILVSLRLGIDSIDFGGREQVMKLIALPQFAGIVGGESLMSHSFFIVGGSKDFLLFLDPHTTTESFNDVSNLDRTVPVAPTVSRMSWSRLNPSMTVGLFLSSPEELSIIQESLAPFVTFLQEPYVDVNFSDLDGYGM